MRAWMSLEAYKEAIVTADHTKNLMDVTMIMRDGESQLEQQKAAAVCCQL